MRTRFLTYLMIVTFAIVGLNLTYAQDKSGNNNMTGSKSKTTMTKSDSTKKAKTSKKHHMKSKKGSKSKTEKSTK